MASESFLSGLRKGGLPLGLTNRRTGRLLASAVELAVTSDTRRRGLLGRDSLDPSVAMVIAPCSAVHTFFMRFAIDVVFVDRQGRVLKVVTDLKPWRVAGTLRAHAVIELNAGTLSRTGGLAVGDVLSVA